MYIGGGKVTFDACNIYKNTATQVRSSLAPYIHRPDGLSVQLTCAFDSHPCGSPHRSAVCAPLALPPKSTAPMDHLPRPSPQGGGVYIEGGTVTLDNCNIYANTASDVRARLAPYIHRPDGSPSLPVLVGRRRVHRRRQGDLRRLQHLQEHRHPSAL